MLDYRIYTFLQLCDSMNYRITAEKMNLTQPAITQHIQYLERNYNCKLFIYNGKKLIKTKEAKILEGFARTEIYNEQTLKSNLKLNKVKDLKVGATKTIGDYMIRNAVVDIAKDSKYNLSIIINNTEHLLHLLEHNKIDFAIIEGFFDKQKYDYELYKNERFIGICNENHAFAGKKMSLDSLFSETIIIREEGSGTRSIFEQILKKYNFSVNDFKHKVCLNSFKLIEECILQNIGITFAYEAFLKSNPKMRPFSIGDNEIIRELNYVFLKGTKNKRDGYLYFK